MEDQTMGTVEVANLLGGSRQWVYKLIKRGELEAVKIGRDWRISKESVKEYTRKATRPEGER